MSVVQGFRSLSLQLLAGTTWDVAPDGKRFLVETPVSTTEGGSRMEAVVNWFEELNHRVPTKH